MVGSYPKLPFLILPLTRLEVPGWGKLMSLFHVLDEQRNSLWKAAPDRTIRGKQHGYKMTLKLSDWSQRLSYFLGRYHEDSLQLLMSVCLCPGDRFVDVGANIGLITLHGSWLVGTGGRIDSFEPNPECSKIVEDIIRINQITNIAFHNAALSESKGDAVLTLFEDHLGGSTLANVVADPNAHVSGTVSVRTEVGDDVLASDPRPIKLIKIDVEGFELNVLKGLTTTLVTSHPIVVTEVIEGQLNAAGSGRKDLTAFFERLGYKPYGLASHRIGRRLRLKLDDLGEDVVAAPHLDFVWLHPGSPSASILTPCISPNSQ
jgi:FkbM family methyltransferase